MSASDLMQGFPPAEDRQVTLANWRKPPFNVWAYQHVREIVPSAEIANDPAAVRPLPAAPADLGGVAVEGQGFEGWLRATDTDALVVLHKGRLVHESYANGMTPRSQHILMSVSKSILGLVAGILVEKGVLDLERPVTDIVPEVAGTAYDGVRLRDLMDMRVGVLFDEDYMASAGPIIAYRKAQGWDPHEVGEEFSDLRSFYARMTERDGGHSGPFHYVSPNTDLMGWAIERAAGRRYADLVGELIWQPIGAERDAYITVDRLGAPRCAGGVCTTARDLARLGQVLVEGGSRDGRRIVPQAWMDDILTAGDRAAWDAGDFLKYLPGLPIHYRAKWYVLRGEAPMMFGLGVFGQYLFAVPDEDLVISKLSSQELPMDGERIMLAMKGVAAIRRHFAGCQPV